MVDVMPQVKEALNTVIKAFYFYPDTFKALPCASYYEAGNAIRGFADDAEYLADVIYVVDVWGETVGQALEAAIAVNGALKKLGFVREFVCDVHDPKSKVRHKTMRFKIMIGDDSFE